MELKARQKKNTVEVAPSYQAPPINETHYSQSISMQFNTLLYATLQNMVENAHTAGDFTYTSVADVIRGALEAYAEGMSLSELNREGERRNISVRVTQKQYDFYQSLPNRLRRKLVERAVRSFIKL
jgi:hypothetical protein